MFTKFLKILPKEYSFLGCSSLLPRSHGVSLIPTSFSFFSVLQAIVLFSIYPSDLKAQDPQLVDRYLSSIQPSTQLQFNEGMAEIASKWKEADNDLQKFQLLDERTGLLEKTVPDRKIEEWVGRIIKLGISKQGDAFLSIRLSGSISKRNQIKTKQEAEKNPAGMNENKDLTGAVFLTRDERLSDLDDKSLIPAGTPLFNLLKRFKSGDEVRFNAQLLPEMGTFIREIDAEMDSRLLNPKFVSRFEYLEKIDIPEQRQSSLRKSETIPEPGKDFEKKPFIRKASSEEQPEIPDKDLLALLPKIDLHLFNEYRLSQYDWNYSNFMDRWFRQVRMNLQTYPPSDYWSGEFPQGGRVILQLQLRKDGTIIKHSTRSEGSVSMMMKEHVERAVFSYELPKLPEHFKHSILSVGFFHDFPPMPHLLFLQKGQEASPKKTVIEPEKTLSPFEEASAKISRRLQRKIKLKQTLELYHFELRKRIEDKIRVFQNFPENERMLIQLKITRPVSGTRWDILEEPQSPAFRLVLLNALERSKIPPLPKLLQDREEYTVLLDIRP
ncbi:MAG: hypothetical protein VW809_07755 [Deltaproteobacteria bacterium]